MATSQPTDNDTYATACEFNNAFSQGDESQPLLTPVNEEDNEELEVENDEGESLNSQQRIPSKHGERTTGNGTRKPRVNNQHDNDDENDPIQILCQTTHYELTNLGKALTCPICCATYQNAVMLPCVHAYCQNCIVQALRVKSECPTCKQSSSKRSLVACPLLNDMAIAYKRIARALGWTPSVYSTMVSMTQLLPPATTATTTATTTTTAALVECHEQLQASKVWQRAMDREDANPMLREERRKVVQVNQSAMVQAAVRRRRNENNTCPRPTTTHEDDKEVARKSVSFREVKTNVTNLAIGNQNDDPECSHTARMYHDNVANVVAKAILQTTSSSQQQRVLTSENDSTLIVAVNNHIDDNTTTKSLECHISVDEDFIQAENVDDDVDKQCNEPPMVTTPSRVDSVLTHSVNNTLDTSVVYRCNRSLDVDPAEMEKVVVAQYSPHDDKQEGITRKDDGVGISSPPTGEADPSHRTETASADDGKDTFPIGAIVRVQSRTWPGINKPGGVARVTKVHTDSHSYDVAYVLGGTEKQVGAAYVILDDEGSTDRATHTRPARLGRNNEIPLSILQALARDGFDTTRTAKRSKTATAPTQKENRKEASCITNSQAVKTLRDRKRKPKVEGVEPPMTKKARNTTLPDLSNEEKCRLANQRYQSLIEKSMNEGIIHVVVSSLPEAAQASLDALARDSKNKNVKLKVSEFYNPKVTTLILLPNEGNEKGLAKVRTLKAMRASLAGIPIVTPEWVTDCCAKEEIKAPDSSMFIHSLPTKTNDLEDSLYGTALLASRMQQVEIGAISRDSVIMPLTNVIVHMCGAFARPPKSDVQLLIRESGGTVQPSLVSTIKLIQSASFQRGDKKVVFLCDDSTDDTICGISIAQVDEIKSAIDTLPGRIQVVHAHWIFDVVTCGKEISGILFAPKSPRCKLLWSTSIDA